MHAFIFDFDGVIVDSERHWKTVGDDDFFPSVVPGWTRADGERMMGLGVRAGYDFLVREYGLSLPFSDYERHLLSYVERVYSALAEPLPGLLALLERLENLPVPIGIASSSRRSWIETALQRLNLTSHFPIICTADDVGERTKPHPDLYLLAAERLGVSPHACIALEDSTNGIAAAKAAGMTCLAIRTDMNEHQDLSLADRVVGHLDEITLDFLKN